MQDICVIDCETTGIDPILNEVIEVAVVILDQKLEIKDKWVSKISPINIETASPRALEINGFNQEEWADAPPLHLALLDLAKKVKGCWTAGHNVSFDLAFLRWGYRCQSIECKEISSLYAPLDTATLAYPLYRRGEVKDTHLVTLAEHFGIMNDKAHRALNDAICIAQVLVELL